MLVINNLLFLIAFMFLKPFKLKFNNIINLVNKIFVNIVLIFILIITVYDHLKIYNNINTRMILGLCLIFSLYIMIFFNILVFCYNFLISIIHSIKMIFELKNNKMELKIKPI